MNIREVVRYCGARRDGKVSIRVDGRPLKTRNDLFNHSPSGFEFGFAGSGPAQTALAILADHFGRGNDIETLTPFWKSPEPITADGLAVKYHQPFKLRAITPIAVETWVITSTDVSAFLAQIVEKRESGRPDSKKLEDIPETDNPRPCRHCPHFRGRHASEVNENGVFACCDCDCGEWPGDRGFEDVTPEEIISAAKEGRGSSRKPAHMRAGDVLRYIPTPIDSRIEQGLSLLERLVIATEAKAADPSRIARTVEADVARVSMMPVETSIFASAIATQQGGGVLHETMRAIVTANVREVIEFLETQCRKWPEESARVHARTMAENLRGLFEIPKDEG